MKRKTIVKLISLVALILILGILKTAPCFADEISDFDSDIENKINTLNNGGSIYITSDILKKSDYIFCREKGAILFGADFYKENNGKPNPRMYPIIIYKNENDEVTDNVNEAKTVKVIGADIAYVLGKYEKGSKTGLGYVDNQWVYWVLLNKYKDYPELQGEIPQDNSLEDKDLQTDTARILYHESQAYQNYIEKIEQFKLNNRDKLDSQEYSPIIKTTENTGISYEINNQGDTIAKVGPITIDYARRMV